MITKCMQCCLVIAVSGGHLSSISSMLLLGCLAAKLIGTGIKGWLVHVDLCVVNIHHGTFECFHVQLLLAVGTCTCRCYLVPT